MRCNMLEIFRRFALQHQIKLISQNIQHRLKPFPVGLGKLLQNIIAHTIACHARMSDSDTHTPIIMGDMRVDRSEAVMAARAAALLDFYLPPLKVKIIMEHDHMRRYEIVKTHGFADSLAG